jgi:hypothetical protein
MYLFSNKYIQINNSTKTNIKVLIEITPLALGLWPLLSRHLDIKSLVLFSFSKLESVWFSLENRG